jgi:hypothetical protein
MKERVLNFNKYIKENIVDDFSDDLSDDYISLKKGVLGLLDDTIKDSSDIQNIKDFIDDYLKEDTSETLVGFVEDVDIYDFYLKYQVDIDDYLNELEYFTDEPEANGISSLYDFVIDGTKTAVISILSEIYDELFE